MRGVAPELIRVPARNLINRLGNAVYIEIGNFLDRIPCFEVDDGEQTVVPYLILGKYLLSLWAYLVSSRYPT